MASDLLDGIATLKKSIDFLVNEDASRPPTLIYQDADLCVVDANHSTILGNASLATELGYAKARARGLSVIKIRHCHNRRLIIGYLSRIARRKMNVTAFWRNAHDPLTEIVVGFKADNPEPDICMYRLDSIPDEIEPNDGITLIMGTHVNLMPDIQSDHPLSDLTRHDDKSLALWYERSLSEGISVDDELWSRLKTLAARLLVESSDDNRDGAGPGRSDND